MRLLVLVIVLVAGMSAYLTVKRIAPTILSANIEEVLASAFGQKVSVGSSSIHLFPVTIITIRDVAVGEASKPIIKTKKIRVILSTWNALFGKIRLIRADLYDPLIYLDYDALKKLKLKQEEKTSPTVRIHDGIVRLPGKDQRVILDEINGTFDSDSAKMTAFMLGGKTQLKAVKNGAWEGAITSRGMDLSGLGKDIRGKCSTEIRFKDSGNKIISSLLLECERIHLPWAKKDIEKAKAEISIQGDEKALTIDRIAISTPLVEVTGTGRISDPRKGTGAIVSLDLKSGTFDYEPVLEFVPTGEFEEWLSKLLTIQIRGGKSRFPVARYQGTIDELVHFRNFLYRIHVEEDIMGQSFCYGPGPEKITGVTGQVIYGKGDIVIRDLRGTVGGSTIDKVTLSFPRALEPFW
ncbi:hypothetical protein EG833_03650, partial [archaeon]|nr:hypothetical protein [archaeon]